MSVEPAAMCMAPCCSNPAASGFLLCWDHWGEGNRHWRNSAWDAFKRSKEANTPAARDEALKEIDQYRRDIAHLFKLRANP